LVQDLFSCLKCTNIKIDYTYAEKDFWTQEGGSDRRGRGKGYADRALVGEKVGKAQLARP